MLENGIHVLSKTYQISFLILLMAINSTVQDCIHRIMIFWIGGVDAFLARLGRRQNWYSGVSP